MRTNSKAVVIPSPGPVTPAQLEPFQHAMEAEILRLQKAGGDIDLILRAAGRAIGAVRVAAYMEQHRIPPADRLPEDFYQVEGGFHQSLLALADDFCLGFSAVAFGVPDAKNRRSVMVPMIQGAAEFTFRPADVCPCPNCNASQAFVDRSDHVAVQQEMTRHTPGDSFVAGLVRRATNPSPTRN